MTSPKIERRESNLEKIIRLARDGYNPYVHEVTDKFDRKHQLLLMWKMMDGKPDWKEIGRYGDEEKRLLNERGMFLQVPVNPSSPSEEEAADEVDQGLYTDDMRRIMNDLGANVEISSDEERAGLLTQLAQEKKPPADKNLQRLRNDIEYYKKSNYVLTLSKKGYDFRATVYRRDDPNAKKIDLGPYEGPIERIFEELDVDVADIRRLKAEGWIFRQDSRGYLRARTTKGGERPDKYIGPYEGPFVKLCKKHGIDVENE
jgi:hypothetical protein